MSIKVEFCSGCVIRASKDSTLSTIEIRNDFKTKLIDLLTEEISDRTICVDTVSCMRYCPENRISLSVNGKMTMAKGTSVEQAGIQIKKELK